MLGRVRKPVVPHPLVHGAGPKMLVRIMMSTVTDPCIPGTGEQADQLVPTLLNPCLDPAYERWHAA